MRTTLTTALATTEHLAREAGRQQVRERARLTVHGWKSHANDLVSDIDLASERLIADGLRAAFPADGVLAEEGSNSGGTSDRRWIVDPLNGTRNYVSGAGPWSVCLALQDGADTMAAVVHDPGEQETFTAIRGAGTALNGERIYASDCSRLAEAIVGFSFNPSLQAKRDMAQVMAVLLPAIGDIRRVPAALNLAYIATGRFDAACCCIGRSKSARRRPAPAQRGGAQAGGCTRSGRSCPGPRQARARPRALQGTPREGTSRAPARHGSCPYSTAAPVLQLPVR